MLLWDSSYNTNTRRSILLGTADNINIIYQSDHLVVDGESLQALDSYGPFYPQSVLVDYEVAIGNAVSNVWPGTTLVNYLEN